jgi:hypothetical protein
MLKPRHHYFSICLSDESGNIRSVVIMSHSRKVTAHLIKKAYETLSLPDTAVLVAVSWLGRMTQEQYREGDIVKTFRDRAHIIVPWLLCIVAITSLLVIKNF